MSEHSADYDAGLCREFIVTGRCGQSDAEHDAISDASVTSPAVGRTTTDNTHKGAGDER